MKICTVDIETRPHIGATWGKWEQNVIWWERYGGIISIAWKMRGEKTKVLALTDYPNYKVGKEDDKQLLIDFCKEVDDADIFIYQNGDRFDLPMIQTRLLYHRLPPLRHRQTIDTLKIFRGNFKFPANNLDEVCEYLGLGNKLRTDKNLWKDCLNPKLPEAVRMKAWKYMKLYNKHDVDLTEEVCELVLPFTKNGVNANVYNNTLIRCPNVTCTGRASIVKRGFSHTALGKFQQYQCMGCYKYMTGEKVGDRVLRK